MITKII